MGEQRRNKWASALNGWAVRGGFMLLGAHLGIPGLGAIAGSAWRHGTEFAGETLSIVLNPGETPEDARLRIETDFAAQGIEADPDSWMFDESTGELSLSVPAGMADAAAEHLGTLGDMGSDAAGAMGDGMADLFASF